MNELSPCCQASIICCYSRVDHPDGKGCDYKLTGAFCANCHKIYEVESQLQPPTGADNAIEPGNGAKY